MQKRKFAIIGLGKFGLKLADVLNEKGAEVVAIDFNAARIEKAKVLAAEVLQLDSTDKEALEKSGVTEVDVVIVGIGDNVETSILTTALLKEIGVKEIITRAINPLHASILKRVGADKVVFPEEDMAIRLAHSIIFPGVKDYLQLKGPWDISEIEIGPTSKLKGKTMGEACPRSKYNVNILMIERESKDDGKKAEIIKIFPHDDYTFRENDILVAFGEPKKIEEFEKACVK